MEQLNFFEITKLGLAVFLSISLLFILLPQNERTNLYQKRFFRGTFIVLVGFFLLFPLNVYDIGSVGTVEGYFLRLFFTVTHILVSSLCVVILILLSSILFNRIKDLWEWIKVN